jgi:hypothetical protein
MVLRVTKTVRIHGIGNGIVSIVCIVLSAIDENVRIHGIGIVSIVCIVFHHLPRPRPALGLGGIDDIILEPDWE